MHFNITAHPTARWTAQQVSEAFPWEAAPRYPIRDRDRVYGPAFRTRVEGMGIEEVLTAPRSPWQNPFAERVIGSIRRECLDTVIVLGERHLRRILVHYLEHYHRWRCHRFPPVAPLGTGLAFVGSPLRQRSCRFHLIFEGGEEAIAT